MSALSDNPPSALIPSSAHGLSQTVTARQLIRTTHSSHADQLGVEEESVYHSRSFGQEVYEKSSGNVDGR